MLRINARQAVQRRKPQMEDNCLNKKVMDGRHLGIALCAIIYRVSD
jgi:hypothetical protein